MYDVSLKLSSCKGHTNSIRLLYYIKQIKPTIMKILIFKSYVFLPVRSVCGTADITIVLQTATIRLDNIANGFYRGG